MAKVRKKRERDGTFESEILPKHQKRAPLFSGQIISTDAVMEDVREWQSCGLEKSCAIVNLGALGVNSRQDGKSCPKSMYVA
jgi:transposase-like protein